MSTVAEERVLVLPTSEFHALGHFQGFTSDLATYLPALLESENLSYRPRGEMEKDPSFKQLIPYMVFRHTDDDGAAWLFQYVRGGGMGEKRLHALRSVGVGGHISTDDAAAGSVHDVYRVGMQRELGEEIALDTPYTETCVGLINDDETPVGRVHLGVVHLFDVELPHVSPREPDMLEASFCRIEEILPELDRFESWSQIVVPALFG
jgi:predicted NUDIX family phosphoesterase